MAAHLLRTVRPCTVSRLVVAQIAQCSGSKCFGASAQCGLEQRGEVRAVVGNIFSLFAAGKYPEAIGNPKGTRNGGEILTGCEGFCGKNAVGAEVGCEDFLEPRRGLVIIAGKRVGIVIVKFSRLRATGSLALSVDDALDGAGDFIAYLLAIGTHVDLQVSLKGNDICLRTGIDSTHGQHPKLGRA